LNNNINNLSNYSDDFNQNVNVNVNQITNLTNNQQNKYNFDNFSFKRDSQSVISSMVNNNFIQEEHND